MENFLYDDFDVKVAEKNESHPFFGEGSRMGYVIDGVQGKTLRLVRGIGYNLKIDTPGHPFYFTTDSVGGLGSPGSLMGNLNPIDQGVMNFVVPANFPDNLYYMCSRHPSMGGRVEVRNNEMMMIPTPPLAEVRYRDISNVNN